MMERFQSRYFECRALVGALIIGFCGCKTSPVIARPVVAQEAGAVAAVKAPVVSWVNGTLKDGEVARLDVLLPQSFSENGKSVKIEGRAMGKRFDFFPAEPAAAGLRYSAIVGVNFGTPAGEKPVVITVRRAGSAKKIQLFSKLVVVPGEYPSETISVRPNHVSPSRQELQQLKRERAELGRIYKSSSRTRLWTGPFQMPMSSQLTSPFGTRRVYNGLMQSFHQGVDFKAAEGTPVLAAGAGKVVLAKNLFLTGNTVIVDHGVDVFTVYAHLSALNARPGEMIPQGHLLGLSGMTGRASGPHLHWGAKVLGSRVNPLSLVQVVQ